MENNIFKERSWCDNWRDTFGDNCLLWFLPVGKPDIYKVALDYGARIPVDGVESEAEQNGSQLELSI